MTFSINGRKGGGYAAGPVQNSFSGTDLADAQLARDTYFAANPTKLAAYDSNPFYLIRLAYLDTVRAEYRQGGAWIDYTPFLQGLPGEVASLVNVPVGELPFKKLDGTFGGSNMRLLDDGSILAPPGFGVESGSVQFGDVLLLSEAAGFLAIFNLLNSKSYTILDYATPRTAPSSSPSQFRLINAEQAFNAQPVFTTNITTNPLVVNYTVQNTARNNALTFKTSAPMSNVLIKITKISNGVVAKYIPSKTAWEKDEGGLEWVAGDNTFDFEDTPLIFNSGDQISFEIRSTTNNILGNASGIPYIISTQQLAEFHSVVMDDDYTPTDVRDKLASLTTTNRLPMSAIRDGVVSVAGRTGVVTLTASDVSGLALVSTSGAYNDLTGKPTIPTAVSQLTNDSGYITSVPVTSVAGKTGAVSLVKADVGLSNVDNTTDALKPVSADQQAAIDLKMFQHNAAADPHPQYTTASEAAAAAPIQSITAGRGITTSTVSGATTVSSTEFPLVFNGSGAVASPKIWIGVVTSNASGVFTVDLSSAGFTAAPVVTVNANLTTATVSNRVWATCSSVSATTATGYTLRGINLSGNGETIRIAPTTAVMVMAIGV